jgi:hypothetical protein
VGDGDGGVAGLGGLLRAGRRGGERKHTKSSEKAAEHSISFW